MRIKCSEMQHIYADPNTPHSGTLCARYVQKRSLCRQIEESGIRAGDNRKTMYIYNGAVRSGAMRAIWWIPGGDLVLRGRRYAIEQVGGARAERLM